jgi:hypothetical protein
MEDEITHTVNFPVCNDPTCICAELEYQQLVADQQRPPKKQRRTLVDQEYEVLSSTLNYSNKGFRLLR